MRKAFYITLSFLLGLSSCGLGPSFQLEELYRQRIPNSPKVIYQFHYSPPFVTGSDWVGHIILDSTATFPTAPATRKDIDELPCCFIEGRVTADNIKMLGIAYREPTENDTLLSAVSHTREKHSGVSIDLIRYKETYESAINIGLQEYQFGSFLETPDSIVLYGVIRTFGALLPDTMAFNKGNIKVVDSANGNINFTEIRTMVVGRGDIYKPGKPFEIVHDRPVVGERTFRFYPKQATLSSGLTDYGIYKLVKYPGV